LSNLGKNIRALRKEIKLSQIDLAKKLNVSQTSVAHYEAGTRQPTIETLKELSQIFNKPIDDLVGNIVIEGKEGSYLSRQNLFESLLHSLLNKNESKFIETFEQNVYPLYQVKEIIDNILKDLMYKIGELWEQGLITEADEHYATNVVRKVVGYVSIKEKRNIKSKKAITFTVGSEKHTLGLEMVNAYLETEGVDSIYLGNDVPIRSLEKVIDEYNPDYIFVSVTLSDSINNLEYLVDHINEKYNFKFLIGVGGQGLNQNEKLTTHRNLHVLKNIDELVDLLNR